MMNLNIKHSLAKTQLQLGGTAYWSVIGSCPTMVNSDREPSKGLS
jgi:hypothetical protein